MSILTQVVRLIFTLVLGLLDDAKTIWKNYAPLKLVACNIKNKYVLVTGAGSGVGQDLCRQLAQLGCHLILWDVKGKGLETTKTMCQKENSSIRILTNVVDLCQREAIYETADKVKASIPNGHVDILVNNAGIVTGKPFLEASDEANERTMQVNVMAHFWTLKAFLPSMIDRNSGHIVSVASLAGLFGQVGMADYCASKFAAVGLEESVRLELAVMQKKRRESGVPVDPDSEGVYSTVVCPYFISSGMFHGISLRYEWLLPTTTVPQAAAYIVDGILRRRTHVIFPSFSRVACVMKQIMSSAASVRLLNALGLITAMDTFEGRQKKD